jgi:hypothetical protein
MAAGTLWPENLLKNPGFEELDEEGFPMYWGRNPAYKGEWTPISDALFAHRGSVCLKMAKGAPKGHVALAQGRFAPGAERNMLVRVWARGSGRLMAYLYLYGAKSGFLSSIAYEPIDVTHEDWKRYEVNLTVPEKAGTSADEVTRFAMAFHVEKGPVYLDDVGLYVKGAEPKEEEGGYFQPEYVPLITIPKVRRAPAIDGTIGRDEWAEAACVTGFHVLSGGFSERQTRVLAAFDEQNLYVGFICPHEGRFGMGSEGRDATFPTSSEAVELWLQPPGTSWFQVLGMPAGGYIDRNDDAGITWNGDWQFANKIEDAGETVGGILTFGKKAWTSEISIAFSELGVKAPADGDMWRINFCRDFSRPQGGTRTLEDWTSWSYMRPSFANAEMFGYARFDGNAPSVRISELGDVESGNLAVQGELFSNEKTEGFVQVEVRTRDEQGKTVLEKLLPVSVSAGNVSPFEAADTLKVGTATEMALRIAVHDARRDQLLTQMEMPFTCMTSFRLTVIPIFAHGYVDVKIEAAKVPNLPDRFSALVEVPGTDLSQAVKLTSDAPSATVRIETSNLTPGDYIVRGCLAGETGQALASSSEPLTVPRKPEWLGNNIGMSEDVPPPWTPLEVKGNTIVVTQREYEPGANGLPSRIVCLGKEIFTAPATLNAIVGGRRLTWKFAPLAPLEAKPHRARWKVAGDADGLRLAGELMMEFDGFSLLRFRITPPREMKFDALWLEFPFTKDVALYARGRRGLPPFMDRYASLYSGTLSGAQEVNLGEGGKWVYSPRWKWDDVFFNDLWVGDDERGFAVMCETDENLSGPTYAQFIPSGDTMMMKVHLVSQKTRLREPLAYELAYQATPARPAPRDPKAWHPYYFATGPEEFMRRVSIACQYHLTKYVSYPELDDPRKTARILENAHKWGVKVVPDAHPAGAVIETPEFKLFGAEWEALPRYGWAAFRGTVRVTCYNSSHPDFMLHTVRKWVEDFNLDGIYIDSGTSPCKNAYHGCGYVDEEGKRHETLPLWATRRFYKRLYTYLHTGDRDGVIFSHTMHETLASGFQDVVTEGEEWAVERERQYTRLSPDMFRAKVMKNQYGTPFTWYTFHQYSWRGNAYGTPVPFREILAMCLPHHVLPTIGDGQGQEQVMPVWDLMDEWWTTSSFIPYWSDESPITTDRDLILSSTYLKPDDKQALVVVSNWNHEAQQARVDFNWKRLGFGPAGLRATEALTGKALVNTGGALSLDLPARDFKILLLEEIR